jgi:hypothetical protein
VPRASRVGGVGSITGVAQHPAEVNNGLSVDVLVSGRIEVLGLRPDGHGNLAAALLHGRADRLQQRLHGMPFDVVAHRMLEDLPQRVAVMAAQVLWLWRRHARSRLSRGSLPLHTIITVASHTMRSAGLF